MATVVAALAWGAFSPASTHAELALSLKRAVALAARSEKADADLDVDLAKLSKLRAGLNRFRLSVDGRASAQVERLYVNAPADLCQSVEGLCGPAHRARLFDFGARLEIPLFAGFGLQAEWARARQLERAALAAKRGRLRSLEYRVAEAYWTVRLTELLAEAAEQALARRSKMAALVEARSSGGLAPRTDANRLVISVLRQEAAVAELKGRTRVARAELAAALELDQPFVLSDDPPALARAPAALEQRLAQAERGRPELEEVQAVLEAQAQKVRMEKGTLWPELALFGEARARNEAFGVPQPELLGFYSAGLMLSWRLWDGLGAYELARRAQVEQQRLTLGRQRLRHRVRAEVEAAHARLLAALEQAEPLSEGRDLASSTLDLMRRRYQSGAALLIEVVEAEDELHALENEVITNAIEIAEAQAALEAASGEPLR